MLFRMGGDEFTVLLEDLRGPEEAAMVAGRVIEAMAEPLQLQHHEIAVTASIGIALYPRDDVVGERLVKAADTAMYRAKELGRNRYEFFTPEMNHRVESQLMLEGALQRALKAREFVLYYQPRVSNATRLAASRAGAGFAARVHTAARGDGSHRPGRHLGARNRLPAGPRMARPRTAARHVGKYLGAPVQERPAGRHRCGGAA
jgi:predicted signal transduction protein with EAL and GGDEF domain